MVTGHAASSSDEDEFACIGNDFAAAKEYEVLDRIGGGTFGEVGCCNAALATDKHVRVQWHSGCKPSVHHLQGQVVRARHKASKRVVALKRVWQNSGDGFSGCSHDANGMPGALPASLLREVEALRMVRHPNVVVLHRTIPLVSGVCAFTCISHSCAAHATPSGKSLWMSACATHTCVRQPHRLQQACLPELCHITTAAARGAIMPRLQRYR